MKLRPVLYIQRHKAQHHMKAMEAGFPGDRCNLDDNRLAKVRGGQPSLHIIGGLQYGALARLCEIRAGGEPYIFYDRAYFGGGPRSDRLRIEANAYQRHILDWHVEPGRARALGVELADWRKDGSHILVVPPGPAIRSLFGLGDWEKETLARLKRCTDRPVRVSYKDDPVPLAERLRNCWAVVTWTSNVAVDAICAGIPAFVSRWSAAMPVAENLAQLESYIEGPRRHPGVADREEWADSLAWGQFNLDEIASGLARSIVMEKFA